MIASSRIYFLLGFMATLSARAALPPLAPDQMNEISDLVVTGIITADSRSQKKKGKWIDVIHELSVEIDSVAKGEGISPGDTVIIRCWRADSRPKGWAGPMGHGAIPDEHDRARFWLKKREDGAWEPLVPNGIERQSPLPSTLSVDSAPEVGREIPHAIDTAMKEAIRIDGSTGGQTEAIDAAIVKWDVEMNRHYRKLLSRLDPVAIESLRDSQRLWIKWRDQELESLRAFYSGMHGSMWVPVSAHARMNLTRDRALALGRLAELSEMREE